MNKIYLSYIIQVSHKNFIGFIINTLDRVIKENRVYFNTIPNSYDATKEELTTSPKFHPPIIEGKEVPNYLIDWAKKITLILEGEDQDTSMIPLDMTDYTEKQTKVIFTVHQQIPVNSFVSYGKVAEIAGLTNAQRFVGTTMRICRQPYIIPCQRVKNIQWIRKHNPKSDLNIKMRMPL